MSDQLPLLSTGELAAEDDPDLKSDYEESEDDLPTAKFSSLHSEDERQFPLMKLPKEVRLNVYDCLFTDLTIGRQREVADLTVIHPPDEWPVNDFSAYRNLLLTCKEVHDEAKSLWENMYIRHCRFNFWKVPELYRVAKLLADLGGPYRRVSYSLRTRSTLQNGRSSTDFMDDLAMELMLQQRGFPEDDPDYYDFGWGWPTFNWAETPGTHALFAGGQVTYKLHMDGRGLTARADFPGLESCSISLHKGFCFTHMRSIHTQYLLISGKVGDVVWGNYDSAAGHAKMLIWEAWNRLEQPSCCLAKSEIVLAWRAQAISGYDKTWLALGGDPRNLSSVADVQEELGLGSWLMAEGP